MLDLVKQKRFDPYVYMSDFEKLKEDLPSKEKFIGLLPTKKLLTKNMFLMFRNKLKIKR